MTGGTQQRPTRVVVVDDRPDTCAGRVAWLSRVPRLAVEGLSFVEALDPGRSWDGVDLAVLDGRDDRIDGRTTLTFPGGLTRVVLDRFLGVQVAREIRRRGDPATVVVLVSAFARENDLLAQRSLEAGVDFLYSVHEIFDPMTFVETVLAPTDDARPAARLSGTDWRAMGLDGRPRLTEVVDAVEASPAGLQVVHDEPGAAGFTNHAQRTLRDDVARALRLSSPVGGGDRRRTPSKRELSPWLRRLLGYGPDERS